MTEAELKSEFGVSIQSKNLTWSAITREEIFFIEERFYYIGENLSWWVGRTMWWLCQFFHHCTRCLSVSVAGTSIHVVPCRGALSLSSHRSCDELKVCPKLRLGKVTEQPQALISSSPIIWCCMRVLFPSHRSRLICRGKAPRNEECLGVFPAEADIVQAPEYP